VIHHVFANRSNIGDWLSAMGIQRALGTPAVCEHLCDGPFVPDTLAALRRAGGGDLVVIGGGGLLMDYFAPFWEGMTEIVRRVPVCTWGIGLCDLKKEHTRPPDDVLREVLGAVRACAVRDELTRGYLHGLGVDAMIAPCPSLEVVAPPPVRGHGILHVDNYTTVGAGAYEAMTALAREFAVRTGRRYRSRNNRIEPGDRDALAAVLASYAASDLVLSSALHGCIVAVAMGLPVIAVSGDYKIEQFMRAAGLDDWVLDADEVDRLPQMLRAAGSQQPSPDFLARARGLNLQVAEKVRGVMPACRVGDGG